jgi:glycosyltransferase involved in cell wall biosynthesis
MDRQPLRVLFVAHSFIIRVSQRRLTALADTGAVTVGLLVPNIWPSQGWYRIQELEKPYSSITYFPSPVWFAGRGGAYIYPPRRIQRAVSEFHPDIVEVEQEAFSLSTFQMAVAARQRHIPFVLLCQENMDRRLSIIRRWTRDYVLHSAELIIAGNRLAVPLLRNWGYQGRLECMTQYGVDTELFSPARRVSGGRVFSIGFVGRYVYQKGIDLIFAAAKLVLERGHQCRIILCGTGPDDEKLRGEAVRLGIEDKVVWREAVRHEGVPTEMAAMDVLILPSRTIPGEVKEQFGHVLIEAMAMGIPVIGSSSGAIPDVIGRQDVVFPEGDAETLAHILLKMIDSPMWREELSRYGLERARHVFSYENIADQLIQLYQSIIEKDSSGHFH